MSQIGALFMIVVMLFTGGVAQAPGTPVGQVCEVSYEFNGDILLPLLSLAGEEMPEGFSAETLETVFDLINLISFTAAYDGSTLRMSANLNDEPVATLEGGMTAEGALAFGTNVLPNYMFGMDAETVSQLQAQGQQLLAQFDLEKMAANAAQLEADIMTAVNESLDTFLTDQNATVTMGSYDLDGVTFTRQLVYEGTSNDLMELGRDYTLKVIDLVEKFMTDVGLPAEQLGLADVKAQLSQETEPVEPEAVIEEDMSQEAEPAVPAVPVYVTRYDMAEGVADNSYVYATLEMADDTAALAAVVYAQGNEGQMTMYFGQGSFASAEEIVNTAYTSPNAVVMEAAWSIEDKENMSATLSAVTAGVFMGYYVENVAVDGGTDTLLEMYLLSDEQPLLCVEMSSRPLTEKMAPVSTEGKFVVDMVQPGQYDDWLSDALEQEAQLGAAKLLVNAIVAAPDEVQALVDAVIAIQGMINIQAQ